MRAGADGWDETVSVEFNLLQRTAKETLGRQITFEEFRQTYAMNKKVEDYVILEGIVVSNTKNHNAGENTPYSSAIIRWVSQMFSSSYRSSTREGFSPVAATKIRYSAAELRIVISLLFILNPFLQSGYNCIDCRAQHVLAGDDFGNPLVQLVNIHLLARVGLFDV